ncbi:hypothetical protein L218DRAFT_362570 [Marasmius fiardii PR-910]|nr:hypothetical protein L218DRAFT_362570 [Marasmius fiardii PR-910]
MFSVLFLRGPASSTIFFVGTKKVAISRTCNLVSVLDLPHRHTYALPPNLPQNISLYCPLPEHSWRSTPQKTKKPPGLCRKRREKRDYTPRRCPRKCVKKVVKTSAIKNCKFFFFFFFFKMLNEYPVLGCHRFRSPDFLPNSSLRYSATPPFHVQSSNNGRIGAEEWTQQSIDVGQMYLIREWFQLKLHDRRSLQLIEKKRKTLTSPKVYMGKG